MARRIVSILILVMAAFLAFSGCMNNAYSSIVLEDGQICKYAVIEDGDTSFLSGVDLMTASKESVAKIQSDDVTIPAAVGEIKTAEAAAKNSAEILNKTYDKWTFKDNQMCVGYNKNADIWFAHGQVEDRNHCTDLLGVVVFDAKTGEILVLTRKTPEENCSLYWDADKSYFVDYKITDNKVRFRYSIHFVNNSDEDITISLSAKFKSKELSGWMKKEEFFKAIDENGDLFYGEIKKGEKEDVIFTFEGQYLGGKVNQNLSFPEEIVLMNY